MKLVLQTVLGLGVAAAIATAELAAGAPVFNVEEHLDEARGVYMEFLGSSKDFYTLEEFSARVGDNPNKEKLFARDDADGDGKVTFDEFKLWFTNGDLFIQLDGATGDERDGSVSIEEFMVEWHGVPVEVFEADDKDSDGLVTYDEFSGPKSKREGEEDVNVFAALDVNRDGIITPDEFEAEWHQVPIEIFRGGCANQSNQRSACFSLPQQNHFFRVHRFCRALCLNL